ncbi:type II toxin-antitoxin system HipA family toxin [Leisingera methylohalidivorans]|uniref:Phosphatidylinositol kinase n=1 Tax=Leisingera methylohalidivorans DSM 14336 TaxID=999552 RepID=V9VYV7_9RHOB|nr:type II toxin-antitoxin system HipA family toxin [Leisingera methylohalidivorans]AHD02092.1 phosphatidylinositol kinase [Leisingera methylohalidivorans DSM 14336]
MTLQVPVYYAQFLVGRIAVHDDGTIGFAYTPEWISTPRAFPISVLMPLGPDPFPNRVTAPWLANLLPEEQQLETLSRSLGLSRTDAVALLREIGGDTAGALSFDSPSLQDQWDYVLLTDYYRTSSPQDALQAHFNDLAQRPFLAGADGVRLSLAGGQQKSALAVLDADGRPVLQLPEDGSRLAIPRNGAPSTVILKPDNPRLPGIVENELYCLTLAQKTGIPAAQAASIALGVRSAICVLRYDRHLSASGRIQRLHQEDFAQATATPPGRKYEVGSVPGFTLANLFTAAGHLEPRDVLNLFDQFAFNILVANTDAHAKNYSILHRLGPSVALAPLYDVSTVLPWPAVNQYFAQKIGGRKRKPADVTPDHFAQIAAELGFRPAEVLNRVTRLVDLMVQHRPAAEQHAAAQPGTAPGYVEQAANCAEQNALRILGRIPRA